LHKVITVANPESRNSVKIWPGPASHATPPPPPSRQAEAKFSASFRPIAESFFCSNPLNSSTLRPELTSCISASLASSTWKKYEAGWSCFREFELAQNQSYSWPLSHNNLAEFAAWCICKKNLQPATAKNYISAINFAHKLKGMSPPPDSGLVELVLRGAKNNPPPLAKPKPCRRAVSLPLLKHLGHKLAAAGLPKASSQSIWAACCLAFFTSARMGELLAPYEHGHDPASSLTWQDIKMKEDGRIIIHIKQPKINNKGGDWLDAFPFPGHNCCPVMALKKHKERQEEGGLWHLTGPVFRLHDGKNLTQALLNTHLRRLLADVVDYEKDGIYCHSFRSGIPSCLANSGDPAAAADTQSWGRWSSSCYTRYTRLEDNKKKELFSKIAKSLNKTSK